jgi:hypothetical protein
MITTYKDFRRKRPTLSGTWGMFRDAVIGKATCIFQNTAIDYTMMQTFWLLDSYVVFRSFNSTSAKRRGLTLVILKKKKKKKNRQRVGCVDLLEWATGWASDNTTIATVLGILSGSLQHNAPRYRTTSSSGRRCSRGKSTASKEKKKRGRWLLRKTNAKSEPAQHV